MQLDRKLLLIAPTIVLVFVAAGLLYAAMQLNVLGSVSDSLKERTAFLSAVERGEKVLEPRQSLALLKAAFDVEARRTAAITASRDLLVVLSAIALVALGALAIGIRGVPRQHSPRAPLGQRGGG